MSMLISPLLVDDDKKIKVDYVTSEMETWLIENIDENKYMIAPNKVCIKHVFVPRPGHQNEYKTDGYYICFENSEDALAFKLQWN